MRANTLLSFQCASPVINTPIIHASTPLVCEQKILLTVLNTVSASCLQTVFGSQVTQVAVINWLDVTTKRLVIVIYASVFLYVHRSIYLSPLHRRLKGAFCLCSATQVVPFNYMLTKNCLLQPTTKCKHGRKHTHFQQKENIYITSFCVWWWFLTSLANSCLGVFSCISDRKRQKIRSEEKNKQLLSQFDTSANYCVNGGAWIKALRFECSSFETNRSGKRKKKIIINSHWDCAAKAGTSFRPESEAITCAAVAQLNVLWKKCQNSAANREVC